MSPFTLYSRKGKTIGTKNRSEVAKGWGRRRVDYKGAHGDFLVNTTILYLDCDSGYMIACICPTH